MAVPGAAEEILVRYCIASGAILIFARSARAGASCQMVPNMLAALDVVRKLMTMIQLSWSLLRKKMPGESDSLPLFGGMENGRMSTAVFATIFASVWAKMVL